MSTPASATGTLSAGPAKDRTDGVVQVGGKNRRAAAAMPASKTVMTLQETAEYLRVTRSTIHRLLKRNQIPGFKIGRHWRFRLEEIENLCSSSVSTKEPKADV